MQMLPVSVILCDIQYFNNDALSYKQHFTVYLVTEELI